MRGVHTTVTWPLLGFPLVPKISEFGSVTNYATVPFEPALHGFAHRPDGPDRRDPCFAGRGLAGYGVPEKRHAARNPHRLPPCFWTERALLLDAICASTGR